MFAKVKYLLAIGFLFLIPACAPSDNVDLSKSYLSSSSPSEELCDIFIGIRNTTAESGGNLDTAEAWEKRIVWTEKILQAAPQDYKENAKVYLQLVKDREKLVAEYNYVQVLELPNEVRRSFISERMDDQLISNILIDYATSNCFDE